jgi:hypothetical protein
MGTRFWPVGPEKIDWTMDLDVPSFGPLHLRSSVAEIKRHLGRPSNPTWLFTGPLLWYQHGPIIALDGRALASLNIAWEDTNDAAGETPVLFGGIVQPARNLTQEMIMRAFGEPIRLEDDDESESTDIEWLRGHHSVSLGVWNDGTIFSIGFKLPHWGD